MVCITELYVKMYRPYHGSLLTRDKITLHVASLFEAICCIILLANDLTWSALLLLFWCLCLLLWCGFLGFNHLEHVVHVTVYLFYILLNFV